MDQSQWEDEVRAAPAWIEWASLAVCVLGALVVVGLVWLSLVAGGVE